MLGFFFFFFVFLHKNISCAFSLEEPRHIYVVGTHSKCLGIYTLYSLEVPQHIHVGTH